jgi:hypothetical protein
LNELWEVFQDAQAQSGVTKLVVVGDAAAVPEAMRGDPRVDVRGGMPHRDLLALLARNTLYLSTSAIENSSTAVLEGLFLAARTTLSDIPAHRDALEQMRLPYTERMVGDFRVLECTVRPPVDEVARQSWDVHVGAFHQKALALTRGK